MVHISCVDLLNFLLKDIVINLLVQYFEDTFLHGTFIPSSKHHENLKKVKQISSSVHQNLQKSKKKKVLMSASPISYQKTSTLGVVNIITK